MQLKSYKFELETQALNIKKHIGEKKLNMTNMHLRSNDAMYINKSSEDEKCWTKSRDKGIYTGSKDYSSGKHKNSAKSVQNKNYVNLLTA